MADTATARARWLVLGFLGVLVLSLAAVLTRPSGSQVAMWWPASPLAAIMVMVMPPRWRVVAACTVAVAVAAGNGLSGRSTDISVTFGLCNGLEALATGWVLGRRGRRPTLRTTADLADLLLAVLVGACVIAATVGPAAWWLADADALQVGRSVFASHGSALLLLLPFALRISPARGEGRLIEKTVQGALLLGLTLATFGPAYLLPLSLAPGAVLVWSAMRFSTRHLLVQNVTLALFVTVATLQGWGLYAVRAAGSGDPLAAANLVQLFCVIVTAMVLAAAVLTQERRAALAEVERLSTHDPLTGAGNRRLLEERVAQAAHLAARGTPSTLLMLDLDGFKAVNDADGHRGGDRVLIAVADRLRTLLRPSDTLARLGGDEFVLLLAGFEPSSPACEGVVARVREALTRRYEHSRQPIGVSIGCTSIRMGPSLDVLLHEADRGVYGEKRHHRQAGPPSPLDGLGVGQVVQGQGLV